jgi:uncharacterized protein YegP (UPF0339 family)
MMVDIFSDAAGEYRYRLKGDNGEIMASSEAYTNEYDAKRGAGDLQRNVLRHLSTDEIEDELRRRQGA